MTGKERFLATTERRRVDRPAAWLGMPTPEAERKLFIHFGVDSLKGLKRKLGDDVWPVEVPYDNPPANHIACAFDFSSADGARGYGLGSLTAPGCFRDVSDPAAVDDFRWPDPSAHMRADECRRAAAAADRDKAVLGVMWSAHFQDACAAFGMETALVKMVTEPEMFTAVIDRITGFYLKANEIFYEAAGGLLDAVLIGNDFGSQKALMVSPALLRRFVFPGTAKLVAQAKSYGLKVMHHSCGAVGEIIGDLADMGADIVHPMQALAEGMQPALLKERFGDRVSFCGGIDVQDLLVSGTPGEVRARMAELKALFPTGLILSPSHEAILPDIPPENIGAIFEAQGGFTDTGPQPAARKIGRE